MAKKSQQEPPAKPVLELPPRRLRSSPTDPPDRIPPTLKGKSPRPPRIPPTSTQTESLATTEDLP